jgi:transcriptional regulator with XRE-family HTH domain
VDDIAERLDLLFRTVTKEGGKEYSYREIEELAGGAITSTSIWKIRTGRTRNPSLKTLQALSAAFEVPVAYFFIEEVTEDDIPAYLQQYRDEKMVEQIALRARDLDDNGKQAILDMINYVRRVQGLNNDDKEGNEEEADAEGQGSAG